jgi:hypothetical protein
MSYTQILAHSFIKTKMCMANAAQGILTYFLRTVNAMRVGIKPPLPPLPPPYHISCSKLA